MRILAFAAIAIGCSRPRDREAPAPVPVATVADAAPVDALPAWLANALARGGPSLCATIQDRNVLVWRRDRDGRLVERLEFDHRNESEPAETIEFRYDSAGRVAKTIRRGRASRAFDATTDFWYDKTGRLERKRVHHDDASALLPGDINVTYRWNGKALPMVLGRLLPTDPEDPSDSLAHALAFSGTVEESRYYDGSAAPQPQHVYKRTYDDRGRLVDLKATGWADSSRHERFEWNAQDQLVAIRSDTWSTQFVWRDDHVVEAAYTSDNVADQFEFHYDAKGRLVEKLRRAPTEPHERIASSKIEDGVLVTTYVTEDAPPAQRWTYRYDCAPAP